MAGISVNPSWINGYADTVEQAADGLTSAARTLQGAPLGSAAFGDLGRSLGAATAYSRAADTLLTQLTKAGADLRSAADSLRTVAGTHSDLDEDQAAQIRRAGPS
ncbi:MAG TPA: hypothetical protein VHW44_26395 [Pseudonocardiaceae bacterium]|nr:hypothetical protein [Pseudonocardiaceae bacterium]